MPTSLSKAPGRYGGAEIARRCQDVATYEQAADEISREVLIGIRTSFITPFDRADIRHLVTAMDDTIDQMQQTAKSIILFEMTTLLFAEGHLGSQFYVPLWVIISCQAAMAVGTCLGGWRIVRTMGSKITRLNPMQGFCAELGGAATLFLATALGIPVSTTHTITGAFEGVGAPGELRRCGGTRQAASS